MYVIGVYKKRPSGRNANGVYSHGTKKSWYVYYLNDNGKFGSFKVTFLQAMYYKTQIVKIKRVKKL